MKLSDTQKDFLQEATMRYAAALPKSPGEEHLANRGLQSGRIKEVVDKFRLGYVAEPLPGHDMYRGMLAIPYLRFNPMKGRWSVVSIRFRCLEDHEHKGHGKYMTQAGDRPRMFNTISLMTANDEIVITEGEIDAITAHCCGIPAVGIPGAKAWKEHFREPFLGYETVYILADGDDAGLRFANTLAQELPNAKIVPCPNGEDVNSVVMSGGKGALLERIQG